MMLMRGWERRGWGVSEVGMKTFCSFSVSIYLEGDGLLGGLHEYSPYLETHASFGDHKVKKKHELVVIGRKERAPVKSVNKTSDGVSTFSYDGEIVTYKTKNPMEFSMEHYGDYNRV